MFINNRLLKKNYALGIFGRPRPILCNVFIVDIRGPVFKWKLKFIHQTAGIFMHVVNSHNYIDLAL